MERRCELWGEVVWKEALFACSRYYPGICLELGKPRNTLVRVVGSQPGFEPDTYRKLSVALRLE